MAVQAVSTSTLDVDMPDGGYVEPILAVVPACWVDNVARAVQAVLRKHDDSESRQFVEASVSLFQDCLVRLV